MGEKRSHTNNYPVKKIIKLLQVLGVSRGAGLACKCQTLSRCARLR